MGLDQYIYRMKKIGKDTLKELNGKHMDNIDGSQYMTIDKRFVDSAEYRDLADILQPIKLVATYIDEQKIKRDAKIPDDWQRTFEMTGRDLIKYVYGKNGECKSVVIPRSVFESRYLYDQEKDFYICRCKEVYYMRKFYDVQDAMYDLYDGDIENLGYHHMSEKMIYTLNDLVGKKVLDTDATNLYYHEWY